MVRLTPKTLLVLSALYTAPEGKRLYGYEITRQTGIPAAQVYPVLQRLHGAGLVDYEWGPTGTGTPPRRYAFLTDQGIAFAAVLPDPAVTWYHKPVGAKS